MNYDYEKMRQEFINKCGYEPTKEELLSYIKDKVEMSGSDYGDVKNPVRNTNSTSGILLLVWFFCSIIALLYFSSIEKPIELMLVFGHYFLVFGLMAFFSSRKVDNYNWLFFVGIAFIFTLAFFPGTININFDPDMFMFLVLGLIFFVVGLVFTGKFVLGLKSSSKFIEVSAKVVGYDNYDAVGACIYEYDFNGRKYKVTNNIYTSGNLPAIGTIKNIKINPNNPNEIITQNMSWFFLIFALPFTLIGGIFVLVALFA